MAENLVVAAVLADAVFDAVSDAVRFSTQAISRDNRADGQNRGATSDLEPRADHRHSRGLAAPPAQAPARHSQRLSGVISDDAIQGTHCSGVSGVADLDRRNCLDQSIASGCLAALDRTMVSLSIANRAP